MVITLVNGSGKEKRWSLFDEKIMEIRKELMKVHEVNYFPIKDLNMLHCRGCWDCWTKFPGQCSMKDDGEAYIASLAHSDLLVFLSPIKAGFITSHAKKALDRFIPHALPFIGMYKGECHHLKRYPKDMRLAIFLMDDGHIDPEAQDIIFETFRRIQRNMRTETLLTGKLNLNNHREVAHEIGNC